MRIGFNNCPPREMGDRPGTPASRILARLDGEMTAVEVAAQLKLPYRKARDTLRLLYNRGRIDRIEAEPPRYRRADA